MPNTISQSVIELMVQLKGAPEAGRKVAALFSSIQDAGNNAIKSFGDINSKIKEGGIVDFTKALDAAKKKAEALEKATKPPKVSNKLVEDIKKTSSQDKINQKRIRQQKELIALKKKESAIRGRNLAVPELVREEKLRKKLRKSIMDLRNARKLGLITRLQEVATVQKLQKELREVLLLRKQQCKMLDKLKKKDPEQEKRKKKKQQKDSRLSKLRSLGQQAENVGRSLTFLGQQTVVFGLALAAAFLPAIVSAAQFEQSVVDAVSVIEGTDVSNLGVRVKDLSADFLDLGERSEFTATQIAGASKQLGLAGFDTSEIKDSIEAVTDLATVGDIAADESARIAASVTSAFKLDAAQFTDVADILASVATNSNTTIQSIAESFKLLAPIASSLGQDLGQVSAAIGVLGDAGIRGCFDPLTEVLTKDGWKFVDKISMEDTFATVNLKSDEVEWHRPVRHFAYQHEGQMFKMSTGEIDMLVTPNHNLVIRGDAGFEIGEAQKKYNKDLIFKGWADGKQTEVIVTIESQETVSYEGMVYCVEVPNNTLIVRRNGVCHVSGNSRAGTGLSRAFSELLEKSDDFDKRLQGIGSSFAAIDPRKNDISAVIKEFERLQDLGKLDTQDFFELFDERSARVVVTLLNQGSEALDDLVSKNKDAAGLAQQIKNFKLDTLVGDFKILKSTLDSLFSEVGQTITPLIREWVQGFTEAAKSIKDWVAENTTLVAAIIEVSIKLGIIVTIVGTVIIAVGSLVTVIGTLIAAFVLLQAVTLPWTAIGVVLSGIVISIAAVVTAVYLWVDATEEYNRTVRDPAVKRALEETKGLIEENAKAASASAEALRDMNEQANLLSRLSDLKPLEVEKLFGGGEKGGIGLGDAKINTQDSIKFDEKRLESSSKKIEELKKKISSLDSKSFLRNATLGASRLFNNSDINGDLEQAKAELREYTKVNDDATENLKKNRNSLKDEADIAKVEAETFEETIAALERGDTDLLGLKAKLASAQADEQRTTGTPEENEANKQLVEDLERQVALEETLEGIRQSKIKMTVDQRAAYEEVRKAKVALETAEANGASEKAIEGLRMKLAGLGGAYGDIVEEQQRLNEKAIELDNLLTNIDSIKSLVPTIDVTEFSKRVAEIQKQKELLFKTDKDGKIETDANGDDIRGDAFTNIDNDIEKVQDSLTKRKAEIKANQAIVAEKDDPEDVTQKARKAEANDELAEQNRVLDKATGETVFDKFEKDAKESVVELQKEKAKIEAAFQSFRQDQAASQKLDTDFIANDQKIKGLEVDLSTASTQLDKDTLKEQIDKLKLQQDKVVAEQKALKAKQAAAKTKNTNLDDVAAQDQEDLNTANFKKREADLKKKALDRKNELKDKKDILLLETKITAAKAAGDKNAEASLTRKLREKELEDNIKQKKKEVPLTQVEEDLLRNTGKGEIDKEIDGILSKNGKDAEKAANRVLSVEDKVLSSLQSQAKTRREQLQLIRLAAKLEDRREARARRKSGDARRSNEKAIKAERFAQQNPLDARAQLKANELRDKTNLKTASANNARTAIGADAIKLRAAIDPVAVAQAAAAAAAALANRNAPPSTTNTPPVGSKPPTPPVATPPPTAKPSLVPPNALPPIVSSKKPPQVFLNIAIEGSQDSTEDMIDSLREEIPGLIKEAFA